MLKVYDKLSTSIGMGYKDFRKSRSRTADEFNDSHMMLALTQSFSTYAPSEFDLSGYVRMSMKR